MKSRQILSIHHISDLISLSPIMNPIKTSFHNHANMAKDSWTQPLKLHRTTSQLLRPIDPLSAHPTPIMNLP